MARLAGGANRRLTAFLLLAFGGTLIGVLLARPHDAVLAVEERQDAILEAASSAGLDDPFLLAGLVYAESRGDPGAVSSIGAQGLCQLLPGTAAELAERLGIEGPPFTPEENLRMGATYLADLLERFGGDVDLALLAYRLGPARVQRDIEELGGAAAWKRNMRARKPGPWEYRTHVLRFAERFRERAAAGHGWGAGERTTS